MANHKSALKRHRQSLTARARNRAVKTGVKNAVKAVRAAIEEKDMALAAEALKNATSALDRAATKNVMHWRTVARKISRLALAVEKIKA